MVRSGILYFLFFLSFFFLFFLFFLLGVEENVTTRLVFFHHDTMMYEMHPQKLKDSKTTRCRDSKLYLHINALLKAKRNF